MAGGMGLALGDSRLMNVTAMFRQLSRRIVFVTWVSYHFAPCGLGISPRTIKKKTDEELLQLAMDSDQLTSKAQGYLTSEFAKRGISAEQIRAFRDEKKQLRIGAPEKLESVASSATVRGRDSYTIAPPLPSETSKAPWRPKVAGRIAFFFGPVAGALVVAISLRRMGYQQNAKKVVLLALGAAAAEAAILIFIPDVLSRPVGFGAELSSPFAARDS